MSAATYTVTELSRRISRALENAFPDDVWVTGEISGLTRSRGHVYFDLIEPTDDPGHASAAVLSVALFRMNKDAVNHQLRKAGVAARMANGVHVRIRAVVQFNERGRLQLRMTGIDPAYTLGRLAADRERVLHALRAEGLIDRNARLTFPIAPLRVGLVTSAGSAAYHDFVHELEISGFAFEVRLVDAKVQGLGAGEQVMLAIRTLARRDVDVIALVRGGGSRADLATFDGEQLARTIAGLDIPVLTGVGHEVDRSIADDVAHRAFKTPTACAAALVTAVRDYRERSESLWARITLAADLALQDQQAHLHACARECTHAARGVLRTAAAESDALSNRFARGATATLVRAEARLDRHRSHASGKARGHVARADARLVQAAATVRIRAPRELSAAERHLDHTAARLRALDPTRLLERGWSITRREDGTAVRSTTDVVAGTRLATRLIDGEVISTVEHATPLPEVDHGEATPGR